MLTVMCPNCRHRFPAPGCCNPGSQSTASGGGLVMEQQHHHHHHQQQQQQQHQSDCVNSNSNNSGGSFYGGGYLLVPREYNNVVGGCFINAPTIIHGPTIIQQPSSQHHHHHHQQHQQNHNHNHNHHETSLVNKFFDPHSVFTNENSLWKSLSRETQPELRSNCDAILGSSGIINGEMLKSSARMNDGSSYNRSSMDCHINTTCDLTGGTVTITTPGIQSGGCLIQSTDAGILVQAPRIEIRPKLSGGGCFLQKQRLPMENEEEDETVEVIYRDAGKHVEALPSVGRFFEDEANSERISLLPPSGCQELPGTRRCSFSAKSGGIDASSMANAEANNPHVRSMHSGVAGEEREECWQHPVNRNNYLEQQQQQQQQEQKSFCNSVTGSEIKKRHSTCCCGSTTREEAPWRASINASRPQSSASPLIENVPKNAEKTSISGDSAKGMEIRVNATVQLPANVDHCTVNITATTGKNSESNGRVSSGSSNGRTRNNFNGGGLVQMDGNLGGLGSENGPERREDAPTTPVSWLIPCPWQFDNYSQDKEVSRLADIKRLLHTSGWYHEGLSWQQSETLLKNAPVGSWLMRDSSDSRFIFAVSVQTARGPTSVRVHYFLGRFRLDAEPRLSHNMPSFECPVKMLEHYVDYSNRIDEHRKEVWVDYSGQLYSQIYLTKPLVKEVRSLSHLARLVVNKNNIDTEHLPPLIKNYLAEYPYSL